jgi:hypothetical protein
MRGGHQTVPISIPHPSEIGTNFLRNVSKYLPDVTAQGDDPSGRDAWVCGRSLFGTVGSNPARVMEACLL